MTTLLRQLIKSPTCFFIISTFWFWWGGMAIQASNSPNLVWFCCSEDHTWVGCGCFIGGILFLGKGLVELVHAPA